MNFLTDKNNLPLHLDTLRRSIEIGKDMIETHKQSVSDNEVGVFVVAVFVFV